MTVDYPGNTAVTDMNELSGRVYRVDQIAGALIQDEHLTWYTPVDVLNTSGKAKRFDVTRTQHRVDDPYQSAGVNVAESQTTFDAYGFPVQVWDRGEIGRGDDDTCAYSEWVRTQAAIDAWLLDRLARSVFADGEPNHPGGYAATCDETKELSIVDHYFDGRPYGEVGAIGDGTKTSTRASTIQGPNPAPWLDTITVYDAAGRVTEVNGPLTTLNDVSRVSYDTAGFARTATDVTGHSMTTVTDRSRGLTLSTTDDNNTFAYDSPTNKTTTSTYDPLGRLLTVTFPGDVKPTLTYRYIRPVSTANLANGPSAVVSEVRPDDAALRSTYSYVDGLGRTRETQSATPTGGRLIAATEFDARGLAIKSFTDYADAAAPGAAMMTKGPFGSSIIVSEARTKYDPFGRVVEAALFSRGVPVEVAGRTVRTTTVYVGSWTNVTTPVGPRADTYTRMDGRVLAVWRGDKKGGYRRFIHIFDGAGNIKQMYEGGVETARTESRYDYFGHPVRVDDPNGGVATYTYREDGALASSTDSTGAKVVYERDVLGRVTSIKDGTGTVLESYAYDKINEAGLLDYASSWYQGGEIRVDTVGYDTRGRPKGYAYAIPNITGLTSGTGLTGTYSFDGITYNRADTPLTLRYPTQGGLTSETVTTNYTALGLPSQMIGSTPYVNKTTYSEQGRPLTRELSLNSYMVKRSYTWEETTGRLTRMTATQGTTKLQDDAHGYDAAGNLIQVTHNPDGIANDHTECFSYDDYGDLARGFTTAGSSCTAVPTVGGPGAYDQSYTYNDHDSPTFGPSGTMTYPTGNNAIRPHAPITAGATTFTYNADGTIATATTGGVQTQYAWNAFDRLISVTAPTSTSTMVYGPGGERVLVKDSTGVHLYLDALAERHYNPSSGKTTEKRYYTFAGATLAVRTLAEGMTTDYYDHIIGDIRGSTALIVRAGATTVPPTLQWYTPWGSPRGTSSTLGTTSRAYVGQHRDSTGLSYLNARYYNPATATFLSVDPLVGKTREPYIYASGNPTTLTDPSGLCASTPEEAAACFGKLAVIIAAYMLAQAGAGQGEINTYLQSQPSLQDGIGGNGLGTAESAKLSMDAVAAYPDAYKPPPDHDVFFVVDIWAWLQAGGSLNTKAGNAPRVSPATTSIR